MVLFLRDIPAIVSCFEKIDGIWSLLMMRFICVYIISTEIILKGTFALKFIHPSHSHFYVVVFVACVFIRFGGITLVFNFPRTKTGHCFIAMNKWGWPWGCWLGAFLRRLGCLSQSIELWWTISQFTFQMCCLVHFLSFWKPVEKVLEWGSLIIAFIRLISAI